MKRGKIALSLLVLCSIVLSVNFALSYEQKVTNISLDSEQVYGEPISGSFVLSLLDAPLNLLFTSEFGSITLKDFLVNDGEQLGCESFDCVGLYSTIDAGSEFTSFKVSPRGAIYGLLFTGEQIVSQGIDLSATANFSEGDKVPLTITIGDDYTWVFDDASQNLENVRQTTYGCFDSAATLSEKNLDSFGYCEEVNLSESKAYYLGANISGSGIEDFSFSLTRDGSEIGSCSVPVESTNYSSSIGCLLSLNELQPSGKFEVCVKSQNEGEISSYKIKKESSGLKCGHYSSYVKDSDYSIFVKVPFYASSSGLLNLGEEFSSSAVDAVNSYLSARYKGKCTSGCVVPLTFKGLNANLELSGIRSDFSSATGPERSTRVYTLVEDAIRIDLDRANVLFDSFKWNVNSYGNQSLNIYLEGDGTENKIYSGNIFSKFLPFVSSVYPSNPPAGLDIYFYASVENNFSKLVWNFGDGSSSVETVTPIAKHKYSNISVNYNITITAFDANSSTSRSFNVTTLSPVDYINDTLKTKRERFNKISLEVNALPLFYSNFIKEKLQFTSIQEGFNKIEILKASALSSTDFLNIVNELNAIVVPISIFNYETKVGTMEILFSAIDPSLVSEIVPGNYSSFEKYKSAIYSWQLKNVYSSSTKKKYLVNKDNGDKINFITSYDLKLKSNENSYYIIQEPKANLHFSAGLDFQDINGKAVYIELSPNEEKSFSFFVEGEKDLVMFVAPSLESIILAEDVSVCNVDKVCQKNIGENSENCPDDCKPLWPRIFTLIGVLIFMLIIYTFLQLWYVVKYEKFLFKDRDLVFNLLAFINNSKLNSKSINEIYSSLLSRGWSREQVTYAVRKAEGKNTGMYELIPVQKLVAYLEMNKAKKNINEKFAPPISKDFAPRTFRPNLPPRPSQKIRSNKGQNFGKEPGKF